MILLEQLKQRRLALGIRQHEMPMRVGMSRQQYQRLERRGNPRLDTLELVAKGLNSELMLIPREKLVEVQAVLSGDSGSDSHEGESPQPEDNPLARDPWTDLL